MCNCANKDIPCARCTDKVYSVELDVLEFPDSGAVSIVLLYQGMMTYLRTWCWAPATEKPAIMLGASDTLIHMQEVIKTAVESGDDTLLPKVVGGVGQFGIYCGGYPISFMTYDEHDDCEQEDCYVEALAFSRWLTEVLNKIRSTLAK